MEAEDRRAKETNDVLEAKFVSDKPITPTNIPVAEPKNKGGRPPGSGKHQVAAAMAEKGIQLSPTSSGGVPHAEIWTQILCAGIISKQVLSANDVLKAVAIADAGLEAFKERFASHNIKKEL